MQNFTGRYFKATALPTPTGFYSISSIKTGERIAVLDSEGAQYRFTDPGFYLDVPDLMDLKRIANTLQPEQDADEY